MLTEVNDSFPKVNSCFDLETLPLLLERRGSVAACRANTPIRLLESVLDKVPKAPAKSKSDLLD